MRNSVLVAPLFATALMLAGTSTAAAETTANAVGGAEQITVSVNSDEKYWVGLVQVDGHHQDFVLGPGGEGIVGPSYVIKNVRPGSHHVVITVGINGGFGNTMLDRNIEVTKADAPPTGSAGR
ncbi:hypothetical protein [Nocardia brasiliensis]|uniref:hypothetical protein n=1 Tax=Nocardia brasiliensis TaxID=37326 RepID=UPI002457C605|nr:hypothetical protein [Nocardia brasiliensis]